MSEWISVEEETPSYKKGAYFTFCDDGEIHENIWYDCEKKHWMENSRMDWYGAYEGKVTHWMPYPKPPEVL